MTATTQTQTVGHGTSRALATTYTYDARSRNKTTTSPSGAVSTSYFDDCCGNISGNKDHFGEGSVRVADAEGRTVYQASVKDFDFAAGNYVDPPAAETTSESTSRYLDDGRVQFTTRWKSARGQIDPQNPPIAGMNGVSVADGVTTQYVYFKNILVPPTYCHIGAIHLILAYWCHPPIEGSWYFVYIGHIGATHLLKGVGISCILVPSTY